MCRAFLAHGTSELTDRRSIWSVGQSLVKSSMLAGTGPLAFATVVGACLRAIITMLQIRPIALERGCYWHSNSFPWLDDQILNEAAIDPKLIVPWSAGRVFSPPIPILRPNKGTPRPVEGSLR